MAVQPKQEQKKTTVEQIEFAGRIIVLAIGMLLMSRNLGNMFIGTREDNSALYSLFARNHIRYGLEQTKLFNVWEIVGTRPEGVYRYLNHPPLMSLGMTIPMLVFGDSERVERLVPIAMTLGSVWMLMVIISRMQSATLALLAGLFYVTFPINAYFGQVVDHEPPVQFFSLLILHGYLQWSGIYGKGYSRKAGAAYYIAGTVLGIWTGWATVIMAGLVWVWNVCRSFREPAVRPLLLWLTVVPAVSQAAVIIHILWGLGWKAGCLLDLFTSRTAGLQDSIKWGGWAKQNWGWMRQNFTLFGFVAGVFYLGIIPVILLLMSPNSPFRQIVRDNTSVMPILLTLLQGTIWLVVFKHQSGIHEYWQYFFGPFLAVSMAIAVFTVFMAVSGLLPRAAVCAAVLLILLPMPSFSEGINIYNQAMIRNSPNYVKYINNIATIYRKLAEVVPPRTAIMTSESYRFPYKFGNYEYYWFNGRALYYANRPVVCSTDIKEIEANRQGCAAYVLMVTDDPNTHRLEQQLNAKYKPAWTDKTYTIFFLNSNAAGYSGHDLIPKN
jgi:hypothetical protein